MLQIQIMINNANDILWLEEITWAVIRNTHLKDTSM